MNAASLPRPQQDAVTIHEHAEGWFLELAGHGSIVEAAVLVRAADWRIQDIGGGRFRFYPVNRAAAPPSALELAAIMECGLSRKPALVLIAGGKR